MSDISSRKADHLDLCATGDVGFKSTSTLLECVRFVHNALPELSVEELDPSVRVVGKRLQAPIVISAMTGGTERARIINKELASIAEERGYGFGLGSQRAILKRPETLGSYQIRDVAPTALVLGNIGGVQAAQMTTEAVNDLAGSVGADAICVHLNPAQEIAQPEGDRDFRGVLDAIGRLARELPIPVVAKETGCGLSAGASRRLAAVGVRHVDVSGAGGTSWVAVEAERAKGNLRALGDRFREWGIPTAASVALAAGAGFQTIIATGGVKDGVDVARAVALGATAGGIARPVLQAFERGGRDGAAAFLAQVEAEFRTVMLLTGSRTIEDLRKAPRVITGELAEWVRQARE